MSDSWITVVAGGVGGMIGLLGTFLGNWQQARREETRIAAERRTAERDALRSAYHKAFALISEFASRTSILQGQMESTREPRVLADGIRKLIEERLAEATHTLHGVTILESDAVARNRLGELIHAMESTILQVGDPTKIRDLLQGWAAIRNGVVELENHLVGERFQQSK